MYEIAPRLFIATENQIKDLSIVDYALVSLASTFHYQMHGWAKGEDHKKDPCYVMCSHSNHILSVNWVDGEAKLYDWNGKGVENMQKILTWIEYQLDNNRKVIIMCNKGRSRSPSMALLYLAKTLKTLPNQSFDAAMEQFKDKYPEYNPGGISDFLRAHWNEL